MGPSAPAPLDLPAFLRLLPALDAAHLLAMSAAYSEGDTDARVAARAAASILAKQRGLRDELSRLQGSIIQWAGSDISNSSAFTLEGLQTNPMLGDLRVQAVPSLLDAATALLLGNALADQQRELLLEPLVAAVGDH